jgi:hypothetical protein
MMGWAGLVACMRTTKMSAEIWWGGLGRPRLRWEYNIKLYLKQIGWRCLGLINLVQERDNGGLL